MKKDTLYAKPQEQIVDFTFNQEVVDVFPDMLRRSIPGYEAIITMLGIFARQYIQPNSNVYDLGCSLGAATYALYKQQPDDTVQYIGIDNSQPMITQCRLNLDKLMPPSQIELYCEDILNSSIENASLVVMNFTLQFLEPSTRQQLINNIYSNLKQGGVLIVSEKVHFDEPQQTHFTNLHHSFKSANLYTDTEVTQKRRAIEKSLLTNTTEEHLARFKEAGFAESYQWFQNLNFTSLIAIKSA